MSENPLQRLLKFLEFSSSDTTVLTFDGQRLVARGDHMNRPKISEMENELRDSGCGPGTIRLRKDCRIVFSGGIDVALHQRLRNLLLS